MTNPIKYASRTYNTVMNDINSDPDLVDKPEWFKRLIAGSHDCMSMMENANANEDFLRTALSRISVADLCAEIDYLLSWKSTSSGVVLFYLNPDTVVFPKTISLEDLACRSEGTTAISSKKFEARSSVVAFATSETFTTDFSTDNILDVARIYTTGELVRVTTTVTLPAGLSVSTDYYAIYVSDTEVTLANTLANAYQGTEITLTSDGTGVHTVTLYSKSVTCYQQDTKEEVSVGLSDGSTHWQEFDLPDLDLIEDTLEIVINSVTWTKVTTLVDSLSTDTHYRFGYKTDGSSYIWFGNGTYGAVPGNFDVRASYAVGGGSDTNISNPNRIISYAGSDSDVVGVSNPSTLTGGSAEESLENAKIVAPLLLKARNRFVTDEDGEALTLDYGGVIRVKVNANIYGLLSSQVPIVPSGGGTPSSALKTALQTYLIAKTVLKTMDVRVVDPTYNAISTVAGIKVKSGYVFADIKPYVSLALRLLYSEVTYEIWTTYLSSGIASAVTYINNKWSYTFGSTSYTQIRTFLTEMGFTNFGVTFQESDVQGFIDTYVDGVDYINISSPAFPITQTDDEITQDNLNDTNLTEIT